ncbi:MAG: hypothetical protein MUF48_24760, partial [Pirellulaceae bacterium]|nr:hypothetical protein [Pirellulaceae bacterium]
EGIEDLRVALGLGADSLTVASTFSGATVTVDAGAGDDTVELRGDDHALNAIAGSLVLLGGPGSNRLRAFDTLDDGPNSGTLSGTQLTGLGMAGTVQYGDMAELLIELGQGDDTLAVLGTRASTEVWGHAGHDQLVVSGDLGQITGPLLFQGGTADGDTDTLRVTASVACDLQLDKETDPRDVQSDPQGVITGAGIPGTIRFQEVEELELALSDEQDWLSVLATTTALSVMAGSGADQLTVQNVSHPTAVTLGGGNDTVVIHGAEAPVIVRGDGEGHDTLILDRSAQTAALTPEDGASIEDGTAGQGVIRHVVSGDVTFDFVETVIVELGQGNDTFTIDLALENTTVNVDGGGGDDTIRVRRIADVVDTIVSGGTGQDGVHVYVDGFPEAEQFVRLRLNVETLTVDNAINTTGVTWTLVNGEVLMADDADDQTSAAPVAVIDTSGAALTQILGGSGQDSLHLVMDTTSNVNGVVLGNRVELQTGVQALTPAGAGTFRDYDQVIDFAGLPASGVSAYDEDGFRLQTTDGTVLIRDTSISTAARTSGESELVSIDGTGQPDGSGFALYSVDLAATGAGDAAVTFRGTTLSGRTVHQSFTVTAGSVATVQLGPQFTALTSVTWTPGTETLLDNIVARKWFVPGTAAPDVAVVPRFQLSSEVEFDTVWGTLRKGTIFVFLDDDDVPEDSGGDAASLARMGISVEIGAAITRFTFPGDLLVPDDTIVTAASYDSARVNGLSLLAENDVVIGSRVTFDMSAWELGPGPGGGAGGGEGLGGAGGTGYGTYIARDGGNGALPYDQQHGGASAQPHGNGAGGAGGTQSSSWSGAPGTEGRYIDENGDGVVDGGAPGGGGAGGGAGGPGGGWPFRDPTVPPKPGGYGGHGGTGGHGGAGQSAGSGGAGVNSSSPVGGAGGQVGSRGTGGSAGNEGVWGREDTGWVGGDGGDGGPGGGAGGGGPGQGGTNSGVNLDISGGSGG